MPSRLPILQSNLLSPDSWELQKAQSKTAGIASEEDKWKPVSIFVEKLERGSGEPTYQANRSCRRGRAAV